MGQLRCLPYKKRFFLWDEQDAHQSIGSNISVELKFIGAVGYAVVNPYAIISFLNLIQSRKNTCLLS